MTFAAPVPSLCGVLGELFGREFAALDVAYVDLRKMLPLLRQVVQREDRGDWADGQVRPGSKYLVESRRDSWVTAVWGLPVPAG